MNALTPRQPGAVAAHQPPAMSPWLRDAMDRAMNPHPDVGADLAVAPEVRAEAARLVARFDAMLAPATLEDWHRFLKPLAYLPAAPSSREDMAKACGLMAFAMPELPAVLLTNARQSEALRRFTFWPKPAEMHEWLGPQARPLHAQRSAVVAVAQAGQQQQARAERTPEEIAAVRAKVQQFRAEMAGKEGPGRAVVAVARPLSDGALLRQYQTIAAEGGPFAAAAAERVAQLRAQIGAGEA